jgi:hypothetical protein
MHYTDQIDLLRHAHPELANEFAAFQGVSDILAWMQRRDLTRAAVDIIGMDEFEYDFLIEQGPGCWLAFGIT